MTRIFSLVCAASLLVCGAGWAQDDPTTEPSNSPGEAGVVATTDAFYPFVENSILPAGHIGTRHSSAVALPNGNFALMTREEKANEEDASNYSILILDPLGNVVAGPTGIFHDNSGPVAGDIDGTETGGDPFLAISPDGSEIAIAGGLGPVDPSNFNQTLFPDDPGTVYAQRLSASDLSPIGTAVSIFPLAVTAPTPDQDNFGSISLAYTANGNILVLARSRDQIDSPLRETFDPARGRVETQRIGTLVVANGDLTQVVTPPKYVGRDYGFDLLDNPNVWNAETGRSANTSPTGAVIYLSGAHGWVSLDNEGNEISEWRFFQTANGNTIPGDGNQGALLTNRGGNLTGRTSPSNPHAAVVYDIASGERLLSVDVSIWEFQVGDRSYGAMNAQGDIFVLWQEDGLFGDNTAVGRFVSADGELSDNTFILLEAGTDAGGAFPHERGQAAFSNSHALYVSSDQARPDGSGVDEVVVRIYENPFGVSSYVDHWELF